MVFPALGALGGLGGAGASGSPSAAATAGPSGASSGSNTITIVPNTPNIGAMIAAVQGSATEGGIPVVGRTGLGPSGKASVNLNLPGASAGVSISPLVLVGGAAAAFLLVMRLRK